MKIIHCADVHLGSSLTTHFDGETAKQRQAELFTTFTNMLDYADKNDVEAIIIAGDLFDKDTGIKKIKTNVMKAIGSHKNIEVYYLRGNHDNSAEVEELPDNLHTFGDEWKTYEVDKDGKITLSGIELNKYNKDVAYNTLNLAFDKYNIVTMHGQQSKYDSKADAEIINLKALQNRNIDYLALGHIHSYSEKQLDNRGVYCYPGCLEGRGMDEPGKHGFVLLDINKETLRAKRTFVSFAKREVYHEEVDVSEATTSFEIAELLKEKIKELGCRAVDIVEFILTGEVSVDLEIDETIIEHQIKDMVFYAKVKNKTSIGIDYSQYELDESLKGEFVRTVYADSTLSEEEKATIIKYGIDALAGKEI